MLHASPFRLFLILGVLGLAAFSRAEAARNSAEAVRDYAAAIKEDGAAGLAPLIHPDEQRELRAMLEPVVVAALKDRDRNRRRMFEAFADPYDMKSMMKLDDQQFTAVFLKWVEAQQPQHFSFQKEATFTYLGHIEEGELQHVIVRLRGANRNGRPTEHLIVLTTRKHEGDTFLCLPQDLRTIATVISSPRN